MEAIKEEALRELIDKTRADVSRLEASLVDERAANSKESASVWQKLEGFVSSLGDQVLQPLAKLEQRLATELGEERASRKAQLEEVRHEALLIAQTAAKATSVSVAIERGSSAGTGDTASDVSSQPAGSALVDRIAVLEGAVQSLQRGEASQLRTLLHELTPLTARMGVAEADLRRLVREVAPLHSGVEAMRAEVEALKMHLAAPVPSVPQREEAPVQLASAGPQPSFLEAPATLLDIPRGPQSASSGSCSVDRSTRSGGQSTAAAMAQNHSALASGDSSTSLAAPPLPVLSEDLKESLSNLVHKVGQTLNARPPQSQQPGERAITAPHRPAASDVDAPAQRPAGGSTDADAQAQRPNRPSVATSEVWFTTESQGSNAAPTPELSVGMAELRKSVTRDIAQALRAVQELRERNVSIREENIELCVRQQVEAATASACASEVAAAAASTIPHGFPTATPVLVPAPAASAVSVQPQVASMRRSVSPSRVLVATTADRQRVPSPARARHSSPVRAFVQQADISHPALPSMAASPVVAHRLAPPAGATMPVLGTQYGSRPVMPQPQ